MTDTRAQQYLQDYAQAPKTNETSYWYSQTQVKAIARCAVLLTHNGQPVLYARDDGARAELSIAEDLKRYAECCADPKFGDEDEDDWNDEGILPSHDPAKLFPEMNPLSIGWQEQTATLHGYGDYAISLNRAAAVQGVANGMHHDSFGLLMTLDDRCWGTRTEVFNVCKRALPPCTDPMAALLCARRMADKYGGTTQDSIYKPLCDYFKAQADTPRAAGSLFAAPIPQPVPFEYGADGSTPDDKPLVVLVVPIDSTPAPFSGFRGWPEIAERLRAYAPALPM